MDKTRQLIRSVFDLENPIVRIAERLLDLMLINLFFLLSALPLFSLGPAKAALYQSVVDWRQGLGNRYWQHFKAFWRQGLVFGWLELLVWAMLALDASLIWGRSGLGLTLFKACLIALACLTSLIHLYLYPLLTKENLSLKLVYQRSLFLVLAHAPWSLTFLFIAMMVFLVVLQSAFSLMISLSLLGILGWSALTALLSFPMEKILNRYF